jgi:hypothetical protein
MGRKKDYKRWNYEDETEISMEEQLTLEDHDYDHGRDTPTSMTTFSQPNVPLTTTSQIHRKKGYRNTRIKDKVSPISIENNSNNIWYLPVSCHFMLKYRSIYEESFFCLTESWCQFEDWRMTHNSVVQYVITYMLCVVRCHFIYLVEQSLISCVYEYTNDAHVTVMKGTLAIQAVYY